MFKKELKRILLSTPHLGDKEQVFIQEAINANWVAPVGIHIGQFEDGLANYLTQNKHITSLNTGTAAIHLAFVLAGVQQRDSVLCQSFTFSASANPILYQGTTPILLIVKQISEIFPQVIWKKRFFLK